MKTPAKTVTHPIWAALIAAGALIGSSALLEYLHPNGALRLAVALAPLPAYVFFILAEVRWIRTLDELHQRVHLEALAIAFPATLVGVVTTWLLQRAGYFPDWRLRDAALFYSVLMIALWIIGVVLAYRRYR